MQAHTDLFSKTPALRQFGNEPHDGDGDADERRISIATGMSLPAHLHNCNYRDQHANKPKPAGERKRFPFPFTGWFWFVGMLVPVIAIVQVGRQAHAGRYTYPPLIGITIAIVWLVAELTERWRFRKQIGVCLHPPLSSSRSAL